MVKLKEKLKIVDVQKEVESSIVSLGNKCSSDIGYLCPFGSRFYFKGGIVEQLDFFGGMDMGGRVEVMGTEDIINRRFYWKKFSDKMPECVEAGSMAEKWGNANFLSSDVAVYHPDGRIKIVNRSELGDSYGEIREGIIYLGNGDPEYSLERYDRLEGIGVSEIGSEKANRVRSAFLKIDFRDEEVIGEVFDDLRNDKVFLLSDDFDILSKNVKDIEKSGPIVLGMPKDDFVYATFIGIGGRDKNFGLYLDGSLLDGVFVGSTNGEWRYPLDLRKEALGNIFDKIRGGRSSFKEIVVAIEEARKFGVYDSGFFNKRVGYRSVKDVPVEFLARKTLEFLVRKESLEEEVSLRSLDLLLEECYLAARDLDFYLRFGEDSPYRYSDFGEIVENAIGRYRKKVEDDIKDAKVFLREKYSLLVRSCGEESARRCLENLLADK